MYKRVIAIFCLLFCISLGLQAQIIAPKKLKYKHPFEHRNFNLGFQMGMTYNSFLVKDQIDIWDEGVLLSDITIRNGLGLNLGMIMNMNLHNHLNIRMIPAVSLEERTFDFHYTIPYDTIEKRRVEAATFDLPLLFQIRSNLYKRHRMYVITGPQVSFNVQNNKNLRDDPSLIKVKGNTFNWVVGVGMNIYGEKIKLSPELRYSIGFTNEYVNRNTLHSGAISALYRQVLTLNILFE
jgi:hypothetical protein